MSTLAIQYKRENIHSLFFIGFCMVTLNVRTRRFPVMPKATTSLNGCHDLLLMPEMPVTDGFQKDPSQSKEKRLFWTPADITESNRPKLIRPLYTVLESWVESSLVVGKSGYGPLLLELYESYAKYFREFPDHERFFSEHPIYEKFFQEISQKGDMPKPISRKQFPKALLFVLKKLGHTNDVVYHVGRKGFFEGLDFKTNR